MTQSMQNTKQMLDKSGLSSVNNTDKSRLITLNPNEQHILSKSQTQAGRKPGSMDASASASLSNEKSGQMSNLFKNGKMMTTSPGQKQYIDTTEVSLKSKEFEQIQ